jgi:hypothetical protein
VVTGVVNPALLCDPTLPKPNDGCPPCSAPLGARCQDQWYSSALRCSDDTQCGLSGACQKGYCVFHDGDADGLDDDFEREIAERNFPRVLLAQDEECGNPLGVIYRARRHPQNPNRIAITYMLLQPVDCGEFNGHDGDATTFAITVDLNAQPGRAATVGVKSWAHMGTVCGSTSSCETGAATDGCGETGNASSSSEVVIYMSRNKHEGYLWLSTCDANCLDSCSVGERIFGPLLNVGEPGHPLVTDLTTQGFVQSADGWGDKLLHFNPWSTVEFLGGGRLDTPLTTLTAPPGE